MLFKIGNRLRNVPGKHQTVYTVIDVSLQSRLRQSPTQEGQPILSLLLRRPPCNHGGAKEHERGEDKWRAGKIQGSAEG